MQIKNRQTGITLNVQCVTREDPKTKGFWFYHPTPEMQRNLGDCVGHLTDRDGTLKSVRPGDYLVLNDQGRAVDALTAQEAQRDYDLLLSDDDYHPVALQLLEQMAVLSRTAELQEDQHVLCLHTQHDRRNNTLMCTHRKCGDATLLAQSLEIFLSNEPEIAEILSGFFRDRERLN